ncbi:phosphoesterase, CapC superfamily, putative [Citrifermentans bemidjiense Bem]|uniref:protein-tyrosine-phosphatase n=1 Tax=Citrifermentans bemidjiense (strain ATCC BAA-1014 / DSM 16622 / JCM 12645 / Bem) TaxID=404380 RepID=B5EBW2_CITBB|nr:CpsB/CapC family capsule biosynthesis tyrosine phosphatase [Citrifermentans bemidjiense]ACH38986.1 phosphoesterase, CapC superfamily, putative [Citrifermentans bemidjiense Bem]
MKEMIDYHCHLLPALDDGATDLDESLKMARILSDFGFSTVYCTPHLISGSYENDPPRVARTTQILQCLLHEAGIPLKLVAGCEHYLDESLPERLTGAFTIGAEKRVLVEVPFRSGPELLRPMVDAFTRLGLAPLLAHPERCRAFEPAVAEHGLRGALSVMLGRQAAEDFEQGEVAALRRSGCLFQGNLGSFAGFYGSDIRERALLFLRHGVYACIGSDAHSSANLQRMLDAGFKAIASEVGTDAALGLFKAVL